jgi:predicted nucleic acid-binding protein
MGLIVDVSVALAWNVAEQATPLAERAADHVAEHGGAVPFHFHLELCNALLVLERRRRLTRHDVDTALQNMTLLNLVQDEGPDGTIDEIVLPLARRHALSAYDAAYLELALRTELPLATRDRALAAAARKAGARLFEA